MERIHTDAPAPPTNLEVVDTSETSVELRWDAAIDNVGVTSYTVYNGTTAVSTTISTTLTVTGLTPSQSYTFRVSASDAAGNESTLSTGVNATTDTPRIISLVLTTSASTVFAGEAFSVTVEARDQYGVLATDYRGGVLFSSTSAFSGLPYDKGLGTIAYSFTEADAGRHTWDGVMLQTSGAQTLSVGDGVRSTAISLTVRPTQLVISVSPSEISAGESVTVTVEAWDELGALIPGYRGGVLFSSTSAFSGLPYDKGLGTIAYGFTGADAGRHTWTGVTLNTPGTHTIAVGDGYRSATSDPITIHDISLTIAVTPTTVFAGEDSLAVTVEARDYLGNLATGYRGAVLFSSTSAFSGLPYDKGLGTIAYDFTEADDGHHTWTGVALHTAGEHTITVGDNFRQATSSPIHVNEVTLQAVWNASSAYVDDRTLTLTIRAVDANGQLVRAYRGALDLNASTETVGLPQSTFSATPDYTFSASDGGEISFATIAFRATGNQTVTVVDRQNSVRQITTLPVAVTTPPEPTPSSSRSSVAAYQVPPTLAPPEPIAMQWGIPYVVTNTLVGSNSWRGYPEELIPASPGTFYLLSGVLQRDPNEWWASTFYVCPYLAWEHTLTNVRLSGGGIDGGPAANDTTALGFGLKTCSGWSSPQNAGAVIPYGPKLTTEEFGAPAGTQGTHLDLHAAGNSSGGFIFSAGPPAESVCEATPAGDPIDTRSGLFYLHETDLGVATGCSEIGLNFVRTYSLAHPQGGALGPGWMHSFELRLITETNRVILEGPRGTRMLFVDVGDSVYASTAGAEQTLVKRPEGGWALIYRNQRADLFDAQGRLIAQQDPNGNLLTMTYEDYDWLALHGERLTGSRLARVDAPGGRYLWFGYDYYHPSRITMVGDNAGRVVRFGYDSLLRLTDVTDPTQATAHYTYSDPIWVLTSKTDAQGQVVFTNTYDSRARVTHQVNNLGQELSFAYEVVPDTEGLTAGSGAAPYLLVTTVTDQIGAQATYTYGADGLLRRMTDPAGATTEYRGYTATRKAGEVEDALGRITTTSYNEQGLPLTISNPLSETTSIAYDSWGRPTVITDTLGRASTFSYEGPNLTRMTDPLGQSTVLTYTAQAGWQGMLGAIANQEGQVSSFTYDTSGDLTGITDALNHTTQLGYDAAGRPETLTDARGYTTTLRYDAADRITGVTDALSHTTAITYDSVGNPTHLTDQLGQTTILTYSLGLPGRPVAIQDAEGGVVTIDYGPLGRPITVTDQLGHQVVTTYDQAGRPVAVTDPLGHTTRYRYDLLGNTTAITDANGHVMSLEYDALNRLREVRNAEGQFLQYGYDPMGNVAVITDTLGYTATVAYDALNRPERVTDQEGRTTRYAYTPLGLTSAITDGNGITSRYLYDALGQLEQVIANARPDLPDGVDVNVRTQFAYDPVGNLREVTDPRNSVTTFTYDGLNRLESLTDPLDRTMRYVYDARGQLERWEKADGTPITYAYDARGLVETVTAPDQTIGYTYDAAGRMETVTDVSGTTTFAYDAASQPLTVTLSLGGSVSYRYDAVGNRTRLIYPDGRTVIYDYNAANQLSDITDWDTGLTHYAYDGNGRVLTTTLPSGVTTSYAYDLSGLVTDIRHAEGASTLAEYAYTYDGSGRRVGAVEDGRVITYTYDGLYRLLDASDSAGESFAYSYDAAGNRLTKAEPGENVTATYDAANQLLTLNGLPVQYDANGNLIDDGEHTYTYDDLDRLVEVTRGITTTTFGYNGNGDRLWQEVNGERTTFTLDLNTALAQVLSQQSGGSTMYLLPGVGQQVNGTWQYSHADALGSVRQLTGSAGQILANMRYSPFGELEARSGPASVLGFTGEPSDPAGSLLYLRARFYHPGMGRFLTPDSIVPELTNGQAWNSYAYVYNDPVNFVDPSGHNPVLLLAAIAGGVALGVGSYAALHPEWWNSPPCECGADTPDPLELVNRGIGTYGGPLAAIPLTSPASIKMGEQYLSRTFDWGLVTL